MTLYGMISSYNDDSKSTVPLIEQTDESVKTFNMPKNIVADRLYITDEYTLSCTHMYDDKEFA